MKKVELIQQSKGLLIYLPGIAFLVYAVGFIVVQAYLLSYGIKIYFLDAGIIKAGLLVIIIVILPLIPIYELRRDIGIRILVICLVYSLIVYFLFFGLDITQILKPLESLAVPGCPANGFLVGLGYYIILLFFLFNFMGLLMLLFLVKAEILPGICVIIYLIILYATNKLLLIFSVWLTIPYALGYFFSKYVLNKKALRPLLYVWLFLFFVLSITWLYYYGANIWPKLGPVWGGGRPLSAKVLLKEEDMIRLEEHNVCLRDSTGLKPVRILYQTSDSYILICDSTGDGEQVIEINKNIIEALIY